MRVRYEERPVRYVTLNYSPGKNKNLKPVCDGFPTKEEAVSAALHNEEVGLVTKVLPFREDYLRYMEHTVTYERKLQDGSIQYRRSFRGTPRRDIIISKSEVILPEEE